MLESNYKSRRLTLIRQARRNLFRNPFDSLITIIIIFLLAWAILSSFDWLINKADWAVVSKNLNLYTFGSYPSSERWRIQLWILLLSTLSFFTLFSHRFPKLKKLYQLFWICILPLGIFLLAGGFGISIISTRSWGGLSLTLVLTFSSAAIALPLGIMLALGRQSDLKLISTCCGLYIDLMRAVPLISVLFFGQLLIPLFLPIDFEISRFLRAAMAFGLFSSAYVAEDIRGGLQAIPATQYEAAKVLGLSPNQTFQLIILPQAFKIALPALTNTAIGLLQNTSLMAILGLVELLGVSRSILANPEFIGRYLEVYIWLAGLYWFMCTVMALLSRQLEKQLNPIK